MGRMQGGGCLVSLLVLAAFVGVATATLAEVPQNDDGFVEARRGRALLQTWTINTPQQALDLAKTTLEPLRAMPAYKRWCPRQLGYIFGSQKNAIALAKSALSLNKKSHALSLVKTAIKRATDCQKILTRRNDPAASRLRSALSALRRAASLIPATVAKPPPPRSPPPKYKSPPPKYPSPKSPPPKYPSPKSPPPIYPPKSPLPKSPPPKYPPPSPTFTGGGTSTNIGTGGGTSDYGHALMLSFLYFEAQRSGSLPSSNRVKWRGNSFTNDGSDNGVDLSGGYYDAGDNVKFGLPMAFTVTMLAYGVVDFSAGYKGELSHALEAIRWGTDYFLKCWKPGQQRLYGQVGDGNEDHKCWQRPEDYTGPRPSYYIDASRPGTELACETAAALAAASVVFRQRDPAYSERCLMAARQLWDFGTSRRGSYSASISNVGSFYPSYSGYDDEILWSTAWMYRSTGEAKYSSFINSFGPYAELNEFSWDNKFAGSAVLLASMSVDSGSPFSRDLWLPRAESFICRYLPGGSIRKTPGGLPVVQYWSNLHYVTGAVFLGAVHRKTMQKAGLTSISRCGKGTSDITTLLTSQTQYILGKNPLGMSYMVGFGNKYPLKPHHRAASIPTPNPSSYIANDYTCQGGMKWLYSSQPNPHVLYGSIVGGPGSGSDDFSDDRNNYAMSEASTYNTASFTGVLAALQI